MALWTPEVRVDLERVREILQRDQPDLAQSALEILGEGWDSLAVAVGGEWVFRFCRRALAARLMHNEISWVPRLAPALLLPVSVPERTGVLSASEPFPYTGHRLLRGQTGCRAGLTGQERARLAAPLGRFLARLHRLPVPADAPSDVLGRGDHVKRGRRALERLAEVDAERIAAQRPAIEALLQAAAYAGPPCWVHGDLYGRHLLFDEDKRLCGIIDWGDLHAGDPAIDLSIGWSFLDPDSRQELLRVYAEEGGQPVDEATCARARLVALDYAGALIPYGLAQSDQAAAALGWLAWEMASQ